MGADKRSSGWGRGGSALGAVWAAVLLVMVGGCGDRNVYVPPPPPKVQVHRPVKKPVTEYLEFTGNAVALNTVQLRARVEGFLDKILFQDGGSVTKGQLLFLLQQDTYEAKLKEAQASVLANKAQLEHAETEFVRYSKLVKKDAAAQTDVDRWHYERDSRRAAVMAAEAQVALAKLNLSYTRITAPFDGRMGRHLKDVGDLVGAGEKTLLAEINQIDPIYVYFNINEHDLLRVRGKDPEPPQDVDKARHPVFVGLANETDYPHKGYLDFAAISLNPTTGSLMLRGIFPNPKYVILPGLFARVRTPVSEPREALLVPETAIGYDQRGPFVRVVNAKNVVERLAVKLGPQEETLRVIQEGLSGDEWVVVSGMLRAIPGRQVTPEQSASSAGPGKTAGPAPQPPPRKGAP